MQLIVKNVYDNIIICEEDKIGKVSTFEIDRKKIVFCVKEGDVIIVEDGNYFVERTINKSD